MSASLLLTVAMLLLPIVLLLAFAGCSQTASGTGDPPLETRPAGPPKEPREPPVVLEPPTVQPLRPGYPDVVLTEPGLVSYWRLGEAHGIVAADSGGAKRDGTYSAGGVSLGQLGALDARDKSDRSAEFDGKVGVVEVAKPVSPPMSLSIEAWISPVLIASQPHAVHTFVSLREVVGGQTRGFELALMREPTPAGGRGIRILFGGQTFLVVPPGGIGDEAWRHVVMTYNGIAAGVASKTLKVYVNGLQVRVEPGVTYVAPTSRPLRIGAGRSEVTTPSDFFAGRVDEIALYNVALDETTVFRHFQAASP